MEITLHEEDELMKDLSELGYYCMAPNMREMWLSGQNQLRMDISI
jgi:hypothetical protein